MEGVGAGFWRREGLGGWFWRGFGGFFSRGFGFHMSHVKVSKRGKASNGSNPHGGFILT